MKTEPSSTGCYALHPRIHKKLPIDHLWLKQDTEAVAWIVDVLTDQLEENAAADFSRRSGDSSAKAKSRARSLSRIGLEGARSDSDSPMQPTDAEDSFSCDLNSWTQFEVACSAPKKSPSVGSEAGPVRLVPITDETILNSQNQLVSCQLRWSGKERGTTVPVTGATVSVDVTLPDDSKVQITLLDDGLHSDGLPDDGTYAAVFTETGAPGSYRLRYRAEKTVDEPVFRREAIGSFAVSSAAARISGNLTDEPVDFDGDGVTDFLQVQFLVTVQQAGSYLASGLIVDEAEESSIAGSETALELPIGTSTVSVLFDCHKLPGPGTHGPFSLRNLELFGQRSDAIAWVDRYREEYTLITKQVVIGQLLYASAF